MLLGEMTAEEITEHGPRPIVGIRLQSAQDVSDPELGTRDRRLPARLRDYGSYKPDPFIIILI